ncbi:hypothetical protein [Microbispora hainanensis]|uniref:hypothetical protein n=1 Tax=Microbispora hainanensis TaxID=568844 RepID=UPI003251864B
MTNQRIDVQPDVDAGPLGRRDHDDSGGSAACDQVTQEGDEFALLALISDGGGEVGDFVDDDDDDVGLGGVLRVEDDRVGDVVQVQPAGPGVEDQRSPTPPPPTTNAPPDGPSPGATSLGMLAPAADKFVGPDIDEAIITLRRLQQVMNNRYTWLSARRRRKIEHYDDVNVIVVIIDEIAYFSATVGDERQQREFISLLRDLVARGRAAGIVVVAATQRPSVDIIPKSMRDLFGYRAAFRCTSSGSSDIILGDGWSGSGYTATDIAPTSQGVCYLIAEGGTPRKIKVAYLTDSDIAHIADYAVAIRRTGRTGRGGSPSPTRRLAA